MKAKEAHKEYWQDIVDVLKSGDTNKLNAYEDFWELKEEAWHISYSEIREGCWPDSESIDTAVTHLCFACGEARFRYGESTNRCKSCPLVWPDGLICFHNTGLFRRLEDAFIFREYDKAIALAEQIRDLEWSEPKQKSRRSEMIMSYTNGNLGKVLAAHMNLQGSKAICQLTGKYLVYMCLQELAKVLKEMPIDEELLECVFSKEELQMEEVELLNLASTWGNDLALLFARMTGKVPSEEVVFNEIYSAIEVVTGWAY